MIRGLAGLVFHPGKPTPGRLLLAAAIGALLGTAARAWDAARPDLASLLGDGVVTLADGVALLPGLVPAALFAWPGALLAGIAAGQAVRFLGSEPALVFSAVAQGVLAAVAAEMWLRARRVDRGPMTMTVAGALLSVSLVVAARILSPVALGGRAQGPVFVGALLAGAIAGWLVPEAISLARRAAIRIGGVR